MDTSREYIKMCEQAEEIQAIWKASTTNEHGGYKSNANQINGGYWVYVRVFWNASDFIAKRLTATDGVLHIWLPRQDQLQDMLNEHFEMTLSKFIQWRLLPLKKYLSSMEQLWLAFVMHEKYNKKWDGEKWELKS